jgi:hypothetical protein
MTVPGRNVYKRHSSVRQTAMGIEYSPGAELLASDSGPASAEQIEDQHYYCDDDQQVDQIAADAAD